MSIELDKIVLVYQECKDILKAKSELMSTTSLADFTHPLPPAHYELCPSMIEVYLYRVIDSWLRKIAHCSQFQARHDKCIDYLESRVSTLKNNNDLLSQESQLLSEIDDEIKNWEEKESALKYYDLKQRRSLKERIVKKLESIRACAEKTTKSKAPLYIHKLERDVKETVTEVFFRENQIDHEVVEFVTKSNSYMCEKVQKLGREVQKMEPNSSLAEEKGRFYEENYETLEKKKAVNQRAFNKYYQSLTGVAKKNHYFWNEFIKSLKHLKDSIGLIKSHFQAFQMSLAASQNKIYMLLEDIPDSIGSIFRAEVIYMLMRIFIKTTEVIGILQSFEARVMKCYQNSTNMEKESREYLGSLVSELPARIKNFYEYALKDKKFLEKSSKAEKEKGSYLLDSFRDFLAYFFDLLKDIRKIYGKENYFEQIQPFQVGHAVGKLIIEKMPLGQHEQNMSERKAKSSRANTANSVSKNQKSQKSEKMLKIEKFLQKMEIFDITSESPNGESYTCALGPKLLLHGKIKIFPQGVYYESFFNKKNLFFGRTYLFIPNKEILQIDEKNTLMIFPDAVEIKTARGSIYFHALGSRKAISSSLIEAYFPQNRDEGDCASEADFQQGSADISKIDMNASGQPFETILYEETYKGIKLNKFFRRYFSDDKFQIRGQTYDNFKTYFLQSIDAINPQSSPLTPECPSYFCYKTEDTSESCPELSERTHTYNKNIPKIPFVSAGGEGLCEEKQVYHWISPTFFYIEATSVVKGFSLTEGMEILVKTILKEENSNVKMQMSATIRFSTNSSTNALLKSPAMSNLKDACNKMGEAILKYEKGKKMHTGKKAGGKNDEEVEQLREQIDVLMGQNTKLKSQRRLMCVIFAALYLLTAFILGIF